MSFSIERTAAEESRCKSVPHCPASGAAAPLRRGILRTLRCTPLVFACAKKIYERQARLAISKRLILGLLAENSQSENRHGPASGAAAPTVRLYAVVTPFKLLPHVRATNQKNLVNLTFNVRIARFYFPGLIIIDEYSIVVRKNQYPV